MGRCSCRDTRCSCIIVQGENIAVTGTGRPDDPYVVSGEAGGGGGAGFDPGDLKWTSRAMAPTGWLIANGQAVSRTSYAALFAAIGTTYGTGDGTTSFNLPDYTGRFMLGVDADHPAGSSGGSETRTLTVDQLPGHTHTINHDHPLTATDTKGAHDHPTSSSVDDTGRDTSHFMRAGSSGQLATNGLVQLGGAHLHNVNIPPYSGASGSTGGGQPINMLPPYTTALPLVKT